MWNHEAKVDKYLYVRTNPFTVRFLGLLGTSSTLLMAVGYSKFIGLSPLYLILFGPIVVIFIFNKLSRYTIQLLYPKFDIQTHERFIYQFWNTHQQPSVDVFLPWAGEDLAMHEEVLRAVKNIEYNNFRVYMLDDKGSEEHKLLAEKYGFVHLSRPNKGEHKKSGNLEYGYNHSSGDYVLILDADFIPTKSSLKDLIPYIASDEKIGILQSPQYLEQHDDVHKRSKIEFGGGNIVEDFYKISQPCRDVFGAAMCVGTSAIYRRDAIDLLDGTPKVHASEDLATGLLITEHGYHVKYLPLIESIGKSPETYQGYFKQHHRWCSGNLVFAYYWPRATMSVVARLIYLGNPAYYLSEAFSVFFSFHFLALLYFHTSSLSLGNTLYFLPYVIFSRIILPLSKSKRSKFGTKLAALSNSYTYIYTYLYLLIKGVPAWHPTGVKTSKLHNDFVGSIDIGIFVSSLFLILFLFIIVTKPSVLGNYNNYLIVGWSLYSAVWHAYFLYEASSYILSNKLTEVNNIIARVLLYAKTHFVPALTGVLAIALIANTMVALHDPYSITVAAIEGFSGHTQASPAPIAQAPIHEVSSASEPAPEQSVTISEPVEESRVLRYQVESGDTLFVIAKRAMREYCNIYDIQPSERTLNTASTKLIKSLYTSNVIHPGEEISFNVESISQIADATLRE